jgi:hypothetical protein
MNLYRQDQSLSIVELGNCDESRALHELKSAYQAGLCTYISAEEAIEKTGFGLSRSDKDFLEVSCSGPDSIVFHSDRLVLPSMIARLLSPKIHFRITVSRTRADEVIRDYFQMPRDKFEATYQEFITR